MTCRNTYTTPCLVSLAGVQEKVKPMLDIYKFLTLTERSVEVREWRADLRFLQQRKVNVRGWWHQRTQICEFAEKKIGFFPYPLQIIHANTGIL